MGIDQIRIAVDQRLIADGVNESFKFMGLPDIVLIAQRDVFALCFGKSRFEITDIAEILRIYVQPDRQTGEIAPDDFDRIVARTVVLNDDFLRLKGLSRNRFELGTDIGCAVVGGNDNGYSFIKCVDMNVIILPLSL